MSAIGEASRFDVVLHVQPPGSTLENTFAAASYQRVFTSTNDLPNQVVAIRVLGREEVGRLERAGRTVVQTN